MIVRSCRNSCLFDSLVPQLPKSVLTLHAFQHDREAIGGGVEGEHAQRRRRRAVDW
jgi:hypothetical protein